MSTSKISEFDLDPNINLAKETSLQSVANDMAKESTLQNMNSTVNDTAKEVTLIEVKALLEELKSLSSNSGGGVKKVQRGSTTGAGTVTIEKVVMEKTVVLSVSKGSAGTVSTSGILTTESKSMSIPSVYKKDAEHYAGDGTYEYETYYKLSSKSYNTDIPSITGTLSGGTTDLTTGAYSAVLTSSTTLRCDGPVEYQVIEYY